MRTHDRTKTVVKQACTDTTSKQLLPIPDLMSVGRFFSGRGAFAGRPNSGEISFYQLETKGIKFSTETLIGKYRISKSRGSNHRSRRPCLTCVQRHCCKNCEVSPLLSRDFDFQPSGKLKT